ncbi:hypothetical protein [Halalkalicoccus sp. NIPERK01]|nr:hypothetical protein [Halalkalicoccus sp. NIPERK01]MDL5361714.1 hypothetical protein [Halalkalicoccus sp. NIPERK01]
MSTGSDEREPSTAVDRVMADVREELVRRVARMDRDRNREIYDALEEE